MPLVSVIVHVSVLMPTARLLTTAVGELALGKKITPAGADQVPASPGPGLFAERFAVGPHTVWSVPACGMVAMGTMILVVKRQLFPSDISTVYVPPSRLEKTRFPAGTLLLAAIGVTVVGHEIL